MKECPAVDVGENGNGNGSGRLPECFDRDWQMAVVNALNGEPIVVGPAVSSIEADRVLDIGDLDFDLTFTFLPPDGAPYRWCPKTFKFKWVPPEKRDADANGDADPLDPLPPEDTTGLIPVPDPEYVSTHDDNGGHCFIIPACDAPVTEGIQIDVREPDQDRAERKARWFLRRVVAESRKLTRESGDVRHTLHSVDGREYTFGITSETGDDCSDGPFEEIQIYVFNVPDQRRAVDRLRQLFDAIRDGERFDFPVDEEPTDEPTTPTRGNGDQFAWMNPATHTLVIDTEDELQDVQFQIVNAKTDCEAVQKLRTVIDHLRETEITLPGCEAAAD